MVRTSTGSSGAPLRRSRTAVGALASRGLGASSSSPRSGPCGLTTRARPPVDDVEPEREAMPDVLRPLAEAAIKRHKKRPYAPDVVTQPEQRYLQELTCPYRDEDHDLWSALLLECFGTRVFAVGQCFMR